MKEKIKVEKLENEELEEVSGGFHVCINDTCKFKPSRWVLASWIYGVEERCGSCIYNPHRNWADSSCDHPNEHED